MEKQHGARGKHSNRKVLRGYIDFMMLSSANKSAPRLGLNKSWIIQEYFTKISEEIPDLRATW
jgi:hypothetical protein